MNTNETFKQTPELSEKSKALKASILDRLKAHDAAVRSETVFRSDQCDAAEKE